MESHTRIQLVLIEVAKVVSDTALLVILLSVSVMRLPVCMQARME